MKTKDDLKNYINENWACDSYEVEKTCEIIDKCRCPLSQTGTDVESHLETLVDEFLSDNDLNSDWFYDIYDDYDELFWDLEFLDDLDDA